MNLNKLMLAGNLTRDIELRTIPSGTAVASFGLAINETYKDRDGNKKENTIFVDCEAWGKTAEILAQYLTKGSPIFIEGALKLATWQDKADGTNRSKLKVRVESFQFVGGKSEHKPSPNRGQQAASRALTGRDRVDTAIDESQIPF